MGVVNVLIEPCPTIEDAISKKYILSDVNIIPKKGHSPTCNHTLRIGKSSISR